MKSQLNQEYSRAQYSFSCVTSMTCPCQSPPLPDCLRTIVSYIGQITSQQDHIALLKDLLDLERWTEKMEYAFQREEVVCDERTL